MLWAENCFNPRVREGRDCRGSTPQGRPTSFNPRVREGRDSNPYFLQASDLCFNPRVREGRDTTICIPRVCGGVSIHASVKDATFGKNIKVEGEEFQSTRP